MEDLLQALVQGGQPQPGAEATDSDLDPTAQLLQGLLGGGTPQGPAVQPDSAPAQGGPDLASLLQSVLGGSGGMPQTPGAASAGSGDLLGAILGGGSPALQSDGILGPIVTGLADKLGLPPQVAQAVVAFVLAKLTENRLQAGTPAAPPPVLPQAARPQGPSLETVVQRMNSGQRVRKAEIRSAGLAEELAANTGLDRATAEASLQEVLTALGSQYGTGR